MIAIARDVNHPSALSNALGVACYMLTFHHDPPRMLRYADGSEELRSRGGMGALVRRRRDEQRVGASAHGRSRDGLQGAARRRRAVSRHAVGPHGSDGRRDPRRRSPGRRPPARRRSRCSRPRRRRRGAAMSACSCPTSTGSWARSTSKAGALDEAESAFRKALRDGGGAAGALARAPCRPRVPRPPRAHRAPGRGTRARQAVLRAIHGQFFAARSGARARAARRAASRP